MTTRLQTPKHTYTIDYPIAVELAEKQQDVYWTAKEIKVEKDAQDILVNMSPSERHGVLTVLKLFTLYELKVGTEYWGNRIMKKFPRPDIQQMAATFSFFELGVHAKFYAKINEALNIATDEFYSEYVKDETLKSRMEFIDQCLDDPDDLFSLGVFALVEGAILYSNFAYLKHFQSQGKNLITNIVAGINFSVRDENLHHEGGAWLFRTLLSESNLSEQSKVVLFDKIKNAAHIIREHEHKIAEKIFEKGKIAGITCHQLQNFIDSRIDLCLANLGIEGIYNIKDNKISDWFYNGINAYIQHDFFNRTGREYNRNWDEKSFTW